jgi:hypothetical protein
VEALKVLVELGANVNTETDRGYTALHLSAGGGQVECVQALVELQADILALDTHGRSPLGPRESVHVYQELGCPPATPPTPAHTPPAHHQQISEVQCTLGLSRSVSVFTLAPSSTNTFSASTCPS